MGSTRLPGKSLLPIGGRPVIAHVIERVRAAETIDRIIVATTTAPEDDPLAAYVETLGVPVHRGSGPDVLNRIVGAAEHIAGDFVVRITGDDPLKDPAVIDRVVGHMLRHKSNLDYVSNTIRPSFPEGQDVEVFRTRHLLEIDRLVTSAYDREHVTPYFLDHQDRYRCHNVRHEPDLSRHRWTLDTAQDLAFFEAVFHELDRLAGMEDVLALVERRPDIVALNSDVPRSDRYRG